MMEDAKAGDNIVNLAERREGRVAADAASSSPATIGLVDGERPRTWRGMERARLREEGKAAAKVLQRVTDADTGREDPRQIRKRETDARLDWLQKLKSGTSKPSILLVEPTPRLRSKFKETLEAEGFDVHVQKQSDLHSVTELPGVNKPIKDKKISYDLIVFGERTQPEKHRPDAEAYRLLLKNRFSVPVLFIGCNAAVEQAIDESKSEGRLAHGYLNKPFKTYIDRSAFYSEQRDAPLSSDARSQLLGAVYSLLTKNHTHAPGRF